MNSSARILIFLMVSIVSVAFLSGCREANAAPQPGKVVFAVGPDGSGHTCQIPFENGKEIEVDMYNDNDYGCKEDEYSYFMFDNAPSRAIAYFYSDYDCSRNGNGNGNQWSYGVQTYNEPTTTIWISIASLNGFAVGDIVKPGVKLIDKYWKSGDIVEEIECAKTHASPVP